MIRKIIKNRLSCFINYQIIYYFNFIMNVITLDIFNIIVNFILEKNLSILLKN